MNKNISCALVVFATGIAPLAQSKVTVEHNDPSKGEYRVTYEIQSAPGKNREFIFPSNGIPSKEAPLQLLSLTDKTTGAVLTGEVLPFKNAAGKVTEGRYVIRTQLPKLAAKSKEPVLEYTLLLSNTSDCRVEENGRWSLQFETAQDATFMVPENQRTVASNLPVQISEENGRILLVQNRAATLKPNETRMIRILTEPCGKKGKSCKADAGTCDEKPGLKWWQARVIKL